MMRSFGSDVRTIGLLAVLILPALGCDTASSSTVASVPGRGGNGGSAGETAEAGAAGVAGAAGAAGVAGADGGEAGTCAPVDPALATADAADLFDYPHVPTFDICLPEDEWEALQVNARDEEYVPAEACFEGTSIGTVGLRFKGAVGSLLNCFNAQDEMICRKLSMKLKFSEYDLEQRFYGLRRLNFQASPN